MMVYITADHRGYLLKEMIKEQLKADGVMITDLGNDEYNPEDDYSVFGIKLGEKVVSENTLGIAICGGGTGICISVNKVKGVRAALCTVVKQASAARHDDDANVVCLSADFVDEETNFEIVKMFINSVFSPEERYIRRIKEIANYESQKC